MGVELDSHGGDTEADFDLYENVNVAAANLSICAKMHSLAAQQCDETLSLV